MVKLFVGGFPLDMTEIDLVKLLSSYGDVSTIKIIRDRKTRICKGYAFIEMTSEQGARDVIAGLHNEPMGDRILTVKFAEDNDTPASKKPSAGPRFSKAKPEAATEARKKRPRKPM